MAASSEILELAAQYLRVGLQFISMNTGSTWRKCRRRICRIRSWRISGVAMVDGVDEEVETLSMVEENVEKSLRAAFCNAGVKITIFFVSNTVRAEPRRELSGGTFVYDRGGGT